MRPGGGRTALRCAADPALPHRFACYTLFQLFFLQVAYRSRWPEHKRKWRTSYLVSNCIVFLASFVWGPISAILTDRHVISTAVWARTWQYSFVGVMFAALTVGFVACVLVVLPHRHTLRSHANLVPIGCLLAALCLSRALYDFLFAANVGSLQRWEANVPAIYYALYFCWEVLPTAMLQALLARWKAQAMRVGRRPVRVTKPRQSELLGLGWSDSSLDTALRDSDATSELSDDGQPDVIAL